jgi:RNA polymerase sigma-70 factor (ECF subfamily)
MDISEKDTGASSALAEEHVLHAVRAGSAETLAELFARHRITATRAAERITRNRAMAEEVVQEVFLAIWRNPEKYRPERGPFLQWLTSFVRNRAIDAVRHEESHRRRLRELMERGAVSDPAHPGVDETVFTALNRRERRRRVRLALAALPNEQRRVLELAHLEGRSMAWIADAERTPIGTVKGRARLGAAKMRAVLRGLEAAEDGSEGGRVPVAV